MRFSIFLRFVQFGTYTLNTLYLLGVWALLSIGVDVLPSTWFIIACILLVVLSVYFVNYDTESTLDMVEKRLGLQYQLHALATLPENDWRAESVTSKLPVKLGFLSVLRILRPQILICVLLWFVAILLRYPSVYIRVFLEEVNHLQSSVGHSRELEALKKDLQDMLERVSTKKQLNQTNLSQSDKSKGIEFDPQSREKKDSVSSTLQKSSDREGSSSNSSGLGEGSDDKGTGDGDTTSNQLGLGSGRGQSLPDRGAQYGSEAPSNEATSTSAPNQREDKPQGTQGSLGNATAKEIRKKIDQLKKDLKANKDNKTDSKQSDSPKSSFEGNHNRVNQEPQNERNQPSERKEQKSSQPKQPEKDRAGKKDDLNEAGGASTTDNRANKSDEAFNYGPGGQNGGVRRYEQVQIQPGNALDSGFMKEVERSQGVMVKGVENADDFRPPNRYKRFFE